MNPRHPKCYHIGGRTPEERHVHQTGVLARLPKELIMMLKHWWVLATWRMSGEAGEHRKQRQ